MTNHDYCMNFIISGQAYYSLALNDLKAIKAWDTRQINNSSTMHELNMKFLQKTKHHMSSVL
jgi:hypothetical protein